MLNAYAESFIGRLRDELLNETLFRSLSHARVMLEPWRAAKKVMSNARLQSRLDKNWGQRQRSWIGGLDALIDEMPKIEVEPARAVAFANRQVRSRLLRHTSQESRVGHFDPVERWFIVCEN